MEGNLSAIHFFSISSSEKMFCKLCREIDDYKNSSLEILGKQYM